MSELTYPFRDEYMEYDYNNHMYIITPKYIYEEYGITLANVLDTTDVDNISALPKLWLKRVSRYIYEFLYSSTPDRLWKEYDLAKNPFWRSYILYWLGEQALYMLNNGDIGLQAGISFEKSNSNDLSQVRGYRLYSPLVVQSMLSTKALYRGNYYTLYTPDYEKDGY